ncbi:hypothetical protein [Chryseobacterium sp.]|uniref:hypothetical protein n=1 Tax=Chryseobacterium sp. TaxID=1871047 RepID=UPI000ECBF4D5|nr:hypothetical protein [Chryseobacterium sp.]HCA06463.1 hypothetical protein [Chryseobacterium sp.]
MIDTEINKLFPADTVSQEDIALKRNFCLNNIVNLIEERHRIKQVKSVPLKEIKKWIEQPDIALNSDLFWFTIVKAFLKILSEPLVIYTSLIRMRPSGMLSCSFAMKIWMN